jgi:hypothetical protein
VLVGRGPSLGTGVFVQTGVLVGYQGGFGGSPDGSVVAVAGCGVFVAGLGVRVGRCVGVSVGSGVLVGASVFVGAGVLGTGVFGTGVFGTGVFGTGVFGTGVFGTGVFGTGVFGTGDGSGFCAMELSAVGVAVLAGRAVTVGVAVAVLVAGSG